ncbi:DUF2630 family protein [Spongiactinospora sp. TRM90649]|uniref:DUF2630 family protein n=1 Tax=Spongiactinospora sp. TRM90649 TaxID=3031114 RepID=UPI0023F9A7B9|nr:DUF2630 family protein [Spongiactinospora sp. TRM90649]MDF5754137.1 DUF2630 family protein [Spongiactinospora sp. TRM90649]
MRDDDILTRINGLIAEEHDLRARLAAGELSSHEENDRIVSLERALDQCWDLLRQRRARREFGENPADAEARPVDEIESYQQ